MSIELTQRIEILTTISGFRNKAFQDLLESNWVEWMGWEGIKEREFEMDLAELRQVCSKRRANV